MASHICGPTKTLKIISSPSSLSSLAILVKQVAKLHVQLKEADAFEGFQEEILPA